MADDFKQQYGPWALVTGASSGIGRAFAQALAARGLNIVTVARRQEQLEQLAEECRSRHGVDVRPVSLDLTAPEFLERLQVQTADLEIGLLVNNAGAGASGAVLEHELETELSLVDLNVRAPVALTRAYAPAMVKRGRGGIIVVSSTVAFMPVPNLSTYGATKTFDLLFAEGLGYELRKSGVHVQALCPGTTSTEFQEKTNTKDFMAMAPEKVVDISLRKLGKRRTVITGFVNKLVAFLTRLVPRPAVTTISALVMNFMRKSDRSGN